MAAHPQKIGILGGTFDPPHYGHLQLATVALSQIPLDRVIWVPNHQPPHRPWSTDDTTQHRLSMVQQAIAPYPEFQLSTVDLERPGPSYGIDTLLDLEQQYPGSDWYWIMGIDAFQRLPRWYGSDRLVDRCTWLVAPRPGLALAETATQGAQVVEEFAHRGATLTWQPLILSPVDCSSTLVRQHCRDQLPIDDLVPPAIAAYIALHQLYRVPESPR